MRKLTIADLGETEQIFDNLEKEIFGKFESELKKRGKKFQRDYRHKRDTLRYPDEGEIEFYWTIDDIYTVGLQFDMRRKRVDVFVKDVDTNDAYSEMIKWIPGKDAPWKEFIKSIDLSFKDLRGKK